MTITNIINFAKYRKEKTIEYLKDHETIQDEFSKEMFALEQVNAIASTLGTMIMQKVIDEGYSFEEDYSAMNEVIICMEAVKAIVAKLNGKNTHHPLHDVGDNMYSLVDPEDVYHKLMDKKDT